MSERSNNGFNTRPDRFLKNASRLSTGGFKFFYG
jgi:hypothetical protein